jgi:hypothetical protein
VQLLARLLSPLQLNRSHQLLAVNAYKSAERRPA